MKRILSRHLLAKIVIASESLRDTASELPTMRRLRIVANASGANSQTRRLLPRRETAAALSSKQPTPRRPRTELRSIPGVGPKNEELLCNKGLITVESLRSVFQEKFDQDQSPFVAYLKEEVGIRHKHHCQSIAGFLTREKESKKERSQERITLSVEGNISAGKTTFLSWLSEELFEIRDLIEVVGEPVDKWQSVGENKKYNLLQRFYEHPEEHAYEFQNYVFLTRLDQNARTFEGTKPLRLLERSVFSDRLVFVRAVHEVKWLTDEQLELYDSWFDPMLGQMPGLIPDGFIYLRADPETCMRRLRRRAREEELKVSNDYLERLHEKHEDWFINQGVWTPKQSSLLPCKPEVVGNLTAELNFPDNDVPVPEEIKDSVIWLGRNEIFRDDLIAGNGINPLGRLVPQVVKTAMSRIPALVLDCNIDIDVHSDVAAKRQYAKIVRTYFEFVKQYGKHHRRFWQSEDAEGLRRKWNMVRNMTEEQLKRATETQIREMNGRFEAARIREAMAV